MDQQARAKSVTSSWGDYFDLAKPRISSLLVIIAALSYVIAIPSSALSAGLGLTVLTVSILCAGIFSLNQYMERDQDAQMVRTKNRPLPSGRLQPRQALVFGVIFLALSFLAAGFFFRPVVLVLFVLIAVLYLLVYTPLKYRTVLHTTLGAIPGAAPPLVGWAVATGSLEPFAWVLFAILFFWQYPHFLAIELMYKDDYARAEVQVATTVTSARVINFQILAALVLLVASSLLPFFLGHSGIGYGIAAIVLGAFYFRAGLLCVLQGTKIAARNLLKASVLYLPCIFLALLLPV